MNQVNGENMKKINIRLKFSHMLEKDYKVTFVENDLNNLW